MALVFSTLKDIIIILIFVSVCVVEARITLKRNTFLSLLIPIVFFIISIRPIYFTIRNLFIIGRFTSIAPSRSLSFLIILMIFIICKIVSVKSKKI